MVKHLFFHGKDLVHHPIKTTLKKWLALGYQIGPNKSKNWVTPNSWTHMMLHPMMFSVFVLEMGVSKNRGYPQIFHFNGVFHYKTIHFGGFPPIFGGPPKWSCYFGTRRFGASKETSPGHVAEFFAGSFLHPI